MQDLTKIPLHEVLLVNGYKLDRNKSSKMYPCLINEENNERLVISKKGENYLYFNPNDDLDRGNILSFARIRNLDVKELIANYDKNINVAQNYKHSFFTAQKSPEIIFKTFQSLQNAIKDDIAHIPLFKQRGFDNQYIAQIIHAFKKDEHNNLIIPNFALPSKNTEQFFKEKNLFICGYTKRLNYPITKDKNGIELSKPLKSLQYGNKGLEIININKKSESIKRIVLTENIIDSLSFGQIKNLNPQESMFISTAGTFNIQHIEQSLFSILDITPNARITLAFDNDEKGKKYTQEVEKSILGYTKKFPFIYKPFSKDCNDDLKIHNITGIQILNQENYQNWVHMKILKYKISNDTNTKALLLHNLRKLHSLKPLSEENIQIFNTIKKHASIKPL